MAGKCTERATKLNVPKTITDLLCFIVCWFLSFSNCDINSMNAKDATSVSISIDLTKKDDKHSVAESNNSQTSGDETDIEDILEFRNKKDSLRLSASNVAAMAGFHPFSSLPQLMLQLVYQSRRGQQLLAHDSR